MKHILWIIALTVLLVSCAGTPTGNVVQENDVVIGGLFGLTGYASFAGEAANNGFLMAIEDSGSNRTYYIENHESDFTKAITAAQKLINYNKAQVIIGPSWEFGEVVKPFAQQGVLFISPWNNFEFEWAKEDNFLTSTPTENKRLPLLIEYMQQQDIQTVAIIYHNNAFAHRSKETFKEEAKGKIEILQEIAIAQDAKDLRSQILRIQQMQPGAIYSVFATDEGQGIFVKQLFELNVSIRTFIPESRAKSEVFLQNYREYAIGMEFLGTATPARDKEFSEKYAKRFGTVPTAISAATAYDITTLVLQAIDAGATTSEDIRRYLLSVKDYEGYSNTINFDDQGFVIANTGIIQRITHEGFERVIWPVE